MFLCLFCFVFSNQKVVDSKHQQMKKLQTQHQRSTHNLEERLRQEEDTLMGLRAALKSKEDELQAYKVSTRDVSVRNASAALSFEVQHALCEMSFTSYR